MLDSPAYRSLDVYARALIVELDYLYNGSNNGSIGLGARVAADRINVGKNKAHKSLRALRERGFIIATNEDEFRFTTGKQTNWRLTWRDCEGAPPSREFMQWRPDKPASKQIEVPLRGTHRPSTGDGGGSDRPSTGDGCPSTGDGLAPKTTPDRPSTGDTYSLPSEARAATTVPSQGASVLRAVSEGVRGKEETIRTVNGEEASNLAQQQDLQRVAEAIGGSEGWMMVIAAEDPESQGHEQAVEKVLRYAQQVGVVWIAPESRTPQ